MSAPIAWPRNLTSAIYGSVLAASVVVGSGSSTGGWALALILLVTGFVFWLAHVYAETVASVHGGWTMGSIWHGMRHEWPLMFAAVPPAVAAAVSDVLENLSPADGAWLALSVAILEQQAWALAAARRAPSAGSSPLDTLWSGPNHAAQHRNRRHHRRAQTGGAGPLTSTTYTPDHGAPRHPGAGCLASTPVAAE